MFSGVLVFRFVFCLVSARCFFSFAHLFLALLGLRYFIKVDSIASLDCLQVLYCFCTVFCVLSYYEFDWHCIYISEHSFVVNLNRF